MIVPISVGSVTDVAARLTAAELQQRLGQPVVVIDKPGAAMVPGAAPNAPNRRRTATRCAWSHPTPCRSIRDLPDLPYNPDKDFVPSSTCIT